ncbi:archaetidylserine decarboxylase [Enterovirga rhinocerotis]|nr:archaetidylserine decarboxylase [Enterovirga rhinocerotis]
MTLRRTLLRIAAQEDLNFLLTNRIPRRLATRLMGRFSRIEQPLVRDLSIATWRLFCDVDLSDARKERFRSLHDAFIRELRDGARIVDADPEVLASPCDAIVGAHGPVEGETIHQIKGMPYRLADLLADPEEAERCRGGVFVTLRLTAGMYHRFHAPADGRIEGIRYIEGDTWNVNPIALKRVEALFCRNERAVLRFRLGGTGEVLRLVPVAAILVAGLRLAFMGEDFDLREGGARTIACDAAVTRGQELGWFEHGSTIVVFAPPGYRFADGVAEGRPIRMGEALLRRDGVGAVPKPPSSS